MSQPTPRQLEAYYWTGIVGLCQQDTATKMSISQPAVNRLLNDFYKIRPKLIPDYNTAPNKDNTIRVDEIDTYDIKDKF